ncbi:MAG: glycoside hydrolase TIM-barrel-like domain-containing protein [Pseudomonadota bacterium]
MYIFISTPYGQTRISDFIGIDNYMPLTDWREGQSHLDAQSGVESIYEESYLEGGIRGGEGYDWFYADDVDRNAQNRTPITDTAHGEDWVFRYKDLWSWWQNPHRDRPGGVRNSATTGWVPQSKPFWFTELGCTATDKGPNQPNVFFDPKSSENARPYFSNEDRDDMIQRRFLEAHMRFWEDGANNPTSALYNGPMVVPERIFLYTWDARPFPDFPVRQGVWADAENWTYGHWLNGRVGKVPLSTLIETLAKESGLPNVDASACQTLVTGYLLSRPMPARDAMEPLLDLYQLDAVERAGHLIVKPRQGRGATLIPYDDLVETGETVVSITRAQEADLPSRLSLMYTDGLSDYETAVAEVKEPSAKNDRLVVIDTAVILEAGEAEGRLSALMAEARTMRTTARFALALGDMRLEPADVVDLNLAAGAITLRLTNITDGPFRQIEAVRTDEALYQPRYTGLSGSIATSPAVAGPVSVAIMDLPLLPEGEDGAFVRVASFASPWPGRVSIYRGEGASAPLIGSLSSSSVMGRLLSPLPPGPTSRWDEGTVLSIKLPAGGLASLDETTVLNGAGKAAVESAPGQWEVMAYREAVLQPDGSWQLRGFLRGLRGTELEAMAGAPADARIVFLDEGQAVSPLSPDAFGTQEVWQAGPATKPPGAFPYREVDATLTGTGARPFAPVHLNAVANGANLDVAWIRRSRIGGDNWAVEEIPLGETTESYRVTSFDDQGAQLEQQTVTSPMASLAAANVASITVEQISSLFGPGRAARLQI